jgi:ABC-type lipoprotein export system ATPase subunit
MISGLDNNYVGSIDGGGIGKVGMAFQEYRLFPSLSAIENVIFAISDKKDEAVYENAKTMLLRLGIEEKDFILKPEELSGGMKQRISLARAFLSPYPILLLDEPTKELDSQNAQTVRRIITELSKEKLVIVVSHNSEDLSLPGAIEINLQ